VLIKCIIFRQSCPFILPICSRHFRIIASFSRFRIAVEIIYNTSLTVFFVTLFSHVK